jgi:hypothetical protein
MLEIRALERAAAADRSLPIYIAKLIEDDVRARFGDDAARNRQTAWMAWR